MPQTTALGEAAQDVADGLGPIGPVLRPSLGGPGEDDGVSRRCRQPGGVHGPTSRRVEPVDDAPGHPVDDPRHGEDQGDLERIGDEPVGDLGDTGAAGPLEDLLAGPRGIISAGVGQLFGWRGGEDGGCTRPTLADQAVPQSACLELGCVAFGRRQGASRQGEPRPGLGGAPRERAWRRCPPARGGTRSRCCPRHAFRSAFRHRRSYSSALPAMGTPSDRPRRAPP